MHVYESSESANANHNTNAKRRVRQLRRSRLGTAAQLHPRAAAARRVLVLLLLLFIAPKDNPLAPCPAIRRAGMRGRAPKLWYFNFIMTSISCLFHTVENLEKQMRQIVLSIWYYSTH